MRELSDVRAAVVGLGYVGLPLAVELGRKYRTLGFDIDAERIAELKRGLDDTLEVTARNWPQRAGCSFTDDVGTATGRQHLHRHGSHADRPAQASGPGSRSAAPAEPSARCIGRGDVVIYESTVYPGATEEVCVPIIEQSLRPQVQQGLLRRLQPRAHQPRRQEHRLTDIMKVTSRLDARGRRVRRRAVSPRSSRPARTRRSSIKVAEAAKVIENTQRDLNIALINELALIFNRLGIDTEEVLQAAGTKWNFLPFRPGLVGGHCIGVDPYYLTLQGRGDRLSPRDHPRRAPHQRRHGRLRGRPHRQAHDPHAASASRGRAVLVLGLTFKENCPDLRNTKVVDIMRELRSYNAHVDVYDPWVDAAEAAARIRHRRPDEPPDAGVYDAVVLAVAHRQFIEIGAASVSAALRTAPMPCSSTSSTCCRPTVRRRPTARL